MGLGHLVARNPRRRATVRGGDGPSTHLLMHLDPAFDLDSILAQTDSDPPPDALTSSAGST